MRKISCQGFPAAPMARGGIGAQRCDGEGLEVSPQSKGLSGGMGCDLR